MAFTLKALIECLPHGGGDPGLGAGEIQVQKVTFLGVWQVSDKQQREHMKILTHSQRTERGLRESGGEQEISPVQGPRVTRCKGGEVQALRGKGVPVTSAKRGPGADKT